MPTQAKVITKGENNISSAVKSASADLNALKGSVEKIGSALKTAFSVTAITASIKTIGSAAKTVMTEDFGMTERAYFIATMDRILEHFTCFVLQGKAFNGKPKDVVMLKLI